MKNKFLLALGLIGTTLVASSAACVTDSEVPAPMPAGTATTVLAATSFEGSFDPFDVYSDSPTSLSSITIVTDPTAPDGHEVAEISQEPGVKEGSFVGGIAYEFPPDAQPTQLWGQFFFKVSSNYVWHSVANKLVYMRMGYQHPVLGTTQTDHILGINNQWIDSANIGWSTQHTTNEDLNQTVCARTPEFTRETWHKVVFDIKMNTPGQYNGIGRIWLNDELVIDADDIMWLNAGNSGGVADFRLTPLWGGSGPEVIQQTQYIYFDAVILKTGS